jgi:hypothetical protein
MGAMIMLLSSSSPIADDCSTPGGFGQDRECHEFIIGGLHLFNVNSVQWEQQSPAFALENHDIELSALALPDGA